MGKQLGKELWEKIERPQGYAYISDVIIILADYRVLSIARNSLEHAKTVVRVLTAFLKKYDRLDAGGNE